MHQYHKWNISYNQYQTFSTYSINYSINILCFYVILCNTFFFEKVPSKFQSNIILQVRFPSIKFQNNFLPYPMENRLILLTILSASLIALALATNCKVNSDGTQDWAYYDQQLRGMSMILGKFSPQLQTAQLTDIKANGNTITFTYQGQKNYKSTVVFDTDSKGTINLRQWKDFSGNGATSSANPTLKMPSFIKPMNAYRNDEDDVPDFLKSFFKAPNSRQVTVKDIENFLYQKRDLDRQRTKILSIDRKQNSGYFYTCKLRTSKKTDPQKKMYIYDVNLFVPYNPTQPISILNQSFKLINENTAPNGSKQEKSIQEPTAQMNRQPQPIRVDRGQNLKQAGNLKVPQFPNYRKRFNQEDLKKQLQKYNYQNKQRQNSKGNHQLTNEQDNENNQISQSNQQTSQRFGKCLRYYKNRCIKCSPKSMPFGDKCVKLQESCSIFNAETGLCEHCIKGYYLNQGICQKNNNSICVQFDNNGKCIACNPQYELLAGNCFELSLVNLYKQKQSEDRLCQIWSISNQKNTVKCMNCLSGSYYSDRFQRCLVIDPNCESFNKKTQQCEKCRCGFTLNRGKCNRR